MTCDSNGCGYEVVCMMYTELELVLVLCGMTVWMMC